VDDPPLTREAVNLAWSARRPGLGISRRRGGETLWITASARSRGTGTAAWPPSARVEAKSAHPRIGRVSWSRG